MDDDAPPGVPEWVVTYGDMMSLLLTFFILLVSLSEVSQEGKYRAIMEAAQQYMGYSGAPLAPPGTNFPMNSILESLQQMQLGSVTDDVKGKGGVKQKAPPGKELRVQRMKENQGVIAGEPIFFSPGSSELSAESLALLEKIAREVVGKPHKLEIQAYSSPYVDGLPRSPAERMKLSYQRANLVMEHLLELRVERERMRISLSFQNSSRPDDEQGTVSQDRVEVTVLDEYAKSYIGRDDDYR